MTIHKSRKKLLLASPIKKIVFRWTEVRADSKMAEERVALFSLVAGSPVRQCYTSAHVQLFSIHLIGVGGDQGKSELLQRT